jgi:FixJ family two-component response regulator
MSGLDLQERLTSLGMNYAVVIMTAYDNPQWRKRAKKAGAVGYLRKPFSEQTLLNAVARCRQPVASNETNDRQNHQVLY